VVAVSLIVAGVDLMGDDLREKIAQLAK
jgi:hypothetical protein